MMSSQDRDSRSKPKIYAITITTSLNDIQIIDLIVNQSLLSSMALTTLRTSNKAKMFALSKVHQCMQDHLITIILRLRPSKVEI